MGFTVAIERGLEAFSELRHAMTPALRRIARGEAPYPPGAYDDADAWNARFVEAHHGVKAADVVARLHATHREFLGAAGAVPEPDFTPGGAARDVFDGSVPAHYREPRPNPGASTGQASSS